MDFNFPAIMVSAVFITGIIWLIDAYILAPKRRMAASALSAQKEGGTMALAEAKETLLKEPVLVEYARSLFPVILAVLVLRSFLVEPFRIPSGSMMPTLLVGDFILVNKFSYGVRLPVINSKIIDVGEPDRGDVMVFRYPKNPSIDYIKRVIGLPGDKVAYYKKQLFINGEPAKQDEQGSYAGVGAGVSMSGANVLQEDLLGVDHDILIDASEVRWKVSLPYPKGSTS